MSTSMSPPEPRARSPRAALAEWVESPLIRNTVTGLIILNAIVLGLETSPAARAAAGPLLAAVDTAVLAIFVVEIGVKLIAFDRRFFHSGWNLFDLAIVTLALLPTSGSLSILRALRILRVLRLLSSVRRLRLLVDSLLRAMPGIGWSGALLLMTFYIFGVMGTELFGSSFPEWFGNLGASMYTLFQIMTLESWSMGIARPVMESYPYAWAFFVPFILISSFMVLNLFIAIIVSATQEVHDGEQRAERLEVEAAAHAEREAMLALLQRIDARLEQFDSGPRR